MNEQLPSKIQSIFRDLKNYQLVGIQIDYLNFSISLDFTTGSAEYDLVIKLFQIVHIVISKAPNDSDGCFFIGEISLTPLREGGQKILSSLQYKFREYPSEIMFHFHLEGEVCMEIICQNYQIFQVLSQGGVSTIVNEVEVNT